MEPGPDSRPRPEPSEMAIMIISVDRREDMREKGKKGTIWNLSRSILEILAIYIGIL